MKQQFILKAAIGVYLVVLVATAYFTRATARRVAGALTGGVAVGVVGVGVETLAHSMGWCDTRLSRLLTVRRSCIQR